MLISENHMKIKIEIHNYSKNDDTVKPVPSTHCSNGIKTDRWRIDTRPREKPPGSLP